MTPSLVNTTKQINTLNDHGANNSSSETQTFQTTENFYSNSKNVLKKKIKSTKIKTKYFANMFCVCSILNILQNFSLFFLLLL
jgi:hypothetical protein